MARIGLISADERLRLRLETALEDNAHVFAVGADPAGLFQAVSVSRPDIAILDLDRIDGFRGSLNTATEVLRRFDPSLPVIAFGDAHDPSLVLSAVRAGCVDVLSRDDATSAIVTAIDRNLKAMARPGREDVRFTLILSAFGGDADAHLSVNLALAHARNGETLLMDAAAGAPEACALLDLSPNYWLQDAWRDLARLDRTLLKSVLPRHEGTGMKLMAGAASSQEEALGPEAAFRVVSAVRSLYREVILRMGPIREETVLAPLVEGADEVLLVCPQTITGVKEAKMLLSRVAAETDTRAKVALVVPEYDSSINLTTEQMQRALDVQTVHRLPPARTELLNAMNAARPSMIEAPNGAYAKFVERLALGPKAEEAPRGLLLRLAPRLLGKNR